MNIRAFIFDRAPERVAERRKEQSDLESCDKSSQLLIRLFEPLED
jgi:hypothetical protein